MFCFLTRAGSATKIIHEAVSVDPLSVSLLIKIVDLNTQDGILSVWGEGVAMTSSKISKCKDRAENRNGNRDL